MTAQCEGMGEVGSARNEPALLPPCPSIRVLSYSNYQEIHSHQPGSVSVKGLSMQVTCIIYSKLYHCNVSWSCWCVNQRHTRIMQLITPEGIIIKLAERTVSGSGHKAKGFQCRLHILCTVYFVLIRLMHCLCPTGVPICIMHE